MAKASDNVFPKLLLAEGSAPATPAAGVHGLFVDTADDKLKRIDSTGTVTQVEGSSASGGRTLIAEVVVGATAQATISFASIPGTYRHLVVDGLAMSNVATADAIVQIAVNGDTGANYVRGRLLSSSTTVAGSSASDRRIATSAGTSSPANTAAAFRVDLPWYSETNFYKHLSGRDSSGASSTTETVSLFEMLWKNTAAITSIDLTVSSGSFTTGSRFALYGIA